MKGAKPSEVPEKMLESHSAFRIGFFFRASRTKPGRVESMASHGPPCSGCGQRLGLHGIFGRAYTAKDGTKHGKNAEGLGHVGTASDRKGPETRFRSTQPSTRPHRPNSGAGRSRHVLRRSDWRHLEYQSVSVHSSSRWDLGGRTSPAQQQLLSY